MFSQFWKGSSGVHFKQLCHTIECTLEDVQKKKFLKWPEFTLDVYRRMSFWNDLNKIFTFILFSDGCDFKVVMKKVLSLISNFRKTFNKAPEIHILTFFVPTKYWIAHAPVVVAANWCLPTDETLSKCSSEMPHTYSKSSMSKLRKW